MTAAVERAMIEAAAWSGPPTGRIRPAPLLLGLLAECECRAAAILARQGIDNEAVRQRWPELNRCPPGVVSHSSTRLLGVVSEPPKGGWKLSRELESSLRAAAARLADCPQPIVFGTEHVLLGLASGDHEVSRWLREKGVDPDTLDAEIHRQYGCHLLDSTDPDLRPLDMPEEEDGWDPSGPPAPPAALEPPPAALPASGAALRKEATRVVRVLDAAANRAREGLRVVEDYVRFVLDDRHLTEQFKCLRHDLVAVLAAVPLRHRLAARETERDVGTGITTRSERSRHDPSAVLTANFTRLQEALRSLEEFGKVLDPQIGSGVERIRYRTYTLQKAVEATRTGLERLHSARLYVLIDGRASADEFAALAHALVGAGVHVLQLRDKRLDDRRLVERARLLRQVTRGSGTLLVVNDRPDVAVLAEADGVHLGQEELTVNDARTLIGPEPLVGVSAHSIEQARQAVLDGANYLGVGPTFPSQTKGFHDYPGPPLLKAVAAEISLPAFAIGGISLENMGQTLASGFHRIAVGAAVTSAPDPARAARDLLAALV